MSFIGASAGTRTATLVRNFANCLSRAVVGRMNTYGKEGPSAPRERLIRSGRGTWREFCEAINLDYDPDGVVALFDKHHVVDTLSFEEAVNTGVYMDHLEGVTTLLCSYGKSHRRETFDRDQPWSPMVNECDGHIFTDMREGHPMVDVYREPWMSDTCVAIRGDKGQAAQLLGKPVLLFDDDVANIASVRRRSRPGCYMDGVLVQRGRRSHRGTPRGYVADNDPFSWGRRMKKFALDPSDFPRRHYDAL